MSRRFDRKTNVFNPNGRITQIEYAIKAINNSGPAVAVIYDGGIAIATEKRTSSSLLIPSKHGDKIFKIDSHISVVVSGLTSDANYLIEYIRETGQQYRYDYGNEMPIEQLVETLCNLKQSYTQYGGMRPFGTSFIFVGCDKHKGFQIFTSDPSGNLGAWKAIAQGSNEENSNNLLQEKYEPSMGRAAALELVTQVILQTLDTAEPDVNKIVIATLERNEANLSDVHMGYLDTTEKGRLIELVNKKNKEAENR
jgi:20S proteasome subunit alpha 3